MRRRDALPLAISVRDLPDDIWIAINKAKVEYLSGMAKLTQELDEIAKGTASRGNGQPSSPHAFAPREQIGNVTAVQVTIGKTPEAAPITDVQGIPSKHEFDNESMTNDES